MSDASHWTPPPGRHQVSVGGSMTRFLKQRKGIQAKQNKAMPTSNYYHFRYNFMPESVDNTKPGVVEVTQGKDVTNVRVERASHQSDEVHTFRGKEEAAKEVECVLIYDEESGMFTLEKLDSSLILQHEGRGQAKARPPSASPLPTPSPAASTSKIELQDDLADLDRELLTTLADDDAEGEIEEDIPLSAASVHSLPPASRKPEPLRAAPVAGTSGKPKPKPGLRGTPATGGASKPKATTKSAANKAVLPPPPLTASRPPPASAGSARSTASTGKGKASNRGAANTMDVDEEVFEFALPSQPVHRPGSAPLRTAATSSLSSGGGGGLALPTAGGSAALAPAPVLPSLPGPPATQEEDEDEDEWDEVAGVGPARPAPVTASADDGSIFGDVFEDAEEGEEINVDQFAAEMEGELLGGLEEEDGDGEELGDDIFGDGDMDADADAEGELEGGAEGESAKPMKPMSLNQFAGGGTVDDVDEDDYSSSEDSDDD